MEKKKDMTPGVDLNALAANDLSALKSADEGDLRILLAFLALSDKQAVAQKLSLTDTELAASLKYWKGAGVLSASKSTVTKKSSPKTESAHRSGKVERPSEMPAYSAEELTTLLEKNRVTAQFINEAQRILGKMFNTHEINILIGMVDYIGFDEQAVLILLSHMAKQEKRTLRYIEKVAFSLYDEGVIDAQALEDHLCRMEQNKAVEGQVRTMFGMTGRALTTKEKKFLSTWVSQMGYDVDVIRMAYDITVDAIHEPSAPYANSILEKWHGEGLKTAQEVSAYLEANKKKTEKKEDSVSSFQTDEFFDAALRRTFDEFLQ